jgi:hypothetical protein
MSNNTPEDIPKVSNIGLFMTVIGTLLFCAVAVAWGWNLDQAPEVDVIEFQKDYDQ